MYVCACVYVTTCVYDTVYVCAFVCVYKCTVYMLHANVLHVFTYCVIRVCLHRHLNMAEDIHSKTFECHKCQQANSTNPAKAPPHGVIICSACASKFQICTPRVDMFGPIPAKSVIRTARFSKTLMTNT